MLIRFLMLLGLLTGVAQADAQPRKPAFEVASVRQNTSVSSASRNSGPAPGRFTIVNVPLRAQDEVIPKGRVIVLAVTLSDSEWTTPNDTGATIDIDLAGSKLNLPLTSGAVTAPAKIQPIDVDITTPTQRPDLHDPKN